MAFMFIACRVEGCMLKQNRKKSVCGFFLGGEMWMFRRFLSATGFLFTVTFDRW